MRIRRRFVALLLTVAAAIPVGVSVHSAIAGSTRSVIAEDGTTGHGGTGTWGYGQGKFPK
jgi:hypothetical protein